MLKVVQKAEKKWEYAVDINLFEDKQGENRVRINFLNSTSDKPGGETISMYGFYGPEVEINIYLENGQMNLYSLENRIGVIVLHEMGHAIGLPHLPYGVSAIMGTSGRQYSADFSGADINLISEFCEDGILSTLR